LEYVLVKTPLRLTEFTPVYVTAAPDRVAVPPLLAIDVGVTIASPGVVDGGATEYQDVPEAT
jgi:hypothetical protein